MLFGSSKKNKFGGFGGFNPGGIVATRDQEEDSDRIARMLGVGGVTVSDNPQATRRGMWPNSGMMGSSAKERAVQTDAMASAMGRGETVEPKGFWNGSKKFGLGDGAAGLMAVLSDAFANQAGQQGGAVGMLAGNRFNARQMAQQAQAKSAEQAAMVQRLQAAGYSPEHAAALAHGDLKPGDLKPDRMSTKTGDIMAFGPDGKPQIVHQETSPEILGVPGMGVYAMDRHTGQPFSRDMTGLTPMTPEEIQAMNLQSGGPTQPASGNFRPRRR